MVDFLTAGLEGFNQLAAAGGQIDAVQASLLAGTTTYAEYQAAAAGVNEQLGQIGARLPGLSEAQVAYAQALIATGVNEQTALAAAQARAEELSRISQFTTAATNENNLYYESLSELPGIIAEIIAADETQIAALDNLILAYNLGGISAEELAAQVLLKADSVAAAAQADAEAEAAALAAANANNAAALSMDLATQAASAEEQALRAATTAAFDAANAGADLDAQARAAADALFAAGNAGASVAEQLARSSNRVDVLTAAYYRLAQAQAAAAGGAVGGASGALDIGGARDGAGDATERLRDRIRAISAFGPIGGSGGRSRGSGGGSGASTADREAERAATEARKFEEQRLRDQERINEQIRDAEEEHYGRLLDIQAEYEERSLQQQRENESDKRRSRFSFYSELTSSDLPQDIQQQLSAAYEEAFAQAQQYAAEGKQELANEYLALKQDQLEAELAFQEAVAAAREKGDQAEVQRLEALAKLRRDAEQAELNNLLAEGDQNVNRRDEAIAEESQRYEDDQAKIADAVEQASQRKVKATDESRAAIEAETRALREQADLLEQLNRQRIPTGESTPADGTPTAPAIPNTQPTSQPAASTTLPDGADTGALLAELQRLVSQGESQLRALSDLARAIDRSAAAQRSIVNKHG
ncbi:MAG: hypothetical protein HC828_02125 [Blastochloris sp.]|nr:hypothetical protein [Blastochloris sp.]